MFYKKSLIIAGVVSILLGGNLVAMDHDQARSSVGMSVAEAFDRFANPNYMHAYFGESIVLPEALRDQLKKILLSRLQLKTLRSQRVLGCSDAKSMILAPNDKVVLGGRGIHIFDLVTGLTAPIDSGSEKVKCMTMTRDGKLITGGKTIRMWNIGSGACLQTLSIAKGKVECMALTSDGTLVAGLNDRHIMQTWDLTGGATTLITDHTGEAINCMTPTADGRVITGCDVLTAYMWNIKNGTRWSILENLDRKYITYGEAQYPRGKRCRIALTHGKLITGDFTLRIWDERTGKSLQSLADGHDDLYHVEDIIVAPDDKLITCAYSCDAAEGCIWDVKTGTLLRKFLNPYNVRSYPKMAVSTADGRMVVKFSDTSMQLFGSAIPIIDRLSVEQLMLVSEIVQNPVTPKQIGSATFQACYKTLPKVVRNYLSANLEILRTSAALLL